MFTIQLRDLHFKSFHGLYAEEKILGNNFIVNVTVKYQSENELICSLDKTINYENIFKIVAQRMSVATELLETLTTQIATEILNSFLLVEEVEISITKQNPPIEKFIGNVVVSYHKKRN